MTSAEKLIIVYTVNIPNNLQPTWLTGTSAITGYAHRISKHCIIRFQSPLTEHKKIKQQSQGLS